MINAARSASSKTINARRTARCTGSTIANRKSKIENEIWARQDSNLGPRDYESPALTAELQAHVFQALNHSILLVTNSNASSGKSFSGSGLSVSLRYGADLKQAH